MKTSNQNDNVRMEEVLQDENGSTPEVTGERYYQDKDDIQFEEFGIQEVEEEKKAEPESV